jgi:hypothetical protein
MSIRLFAAAAVTYLLSHAAIAQDAPASDPVTPVKEKKICRAETATGSVMAKRVCRTKAEWARLREQNERQNEAFRDRPRGAGPSSGQ